RVHAARGPPPVLRAPSSGRAHRQRRAAGLSAPAQSWRPIMATDRSYVTTNKVELARLKSLVARLSDAELSRPMPAGWTVAGVLGHLAFWDQRIVALIDAWGVDGRGIAPPPIDRASVDWVNDAGKPPCLRPVP